MKKTSKFNSIKLLIESFDLPFYALSMHLHLKKTLLNHHTRPSPFATTVNPARTSPRNPPTLTMTNKLHSQGDDGHHHQTK